MASYNLIDEQWIPMVLPDGKPARVGLKKCLLEAHTIKELYHDSPLVQTAVLRLLLAIVYRLFAPANKNEWKALWTAGCFDGAKLNDYFDNWHERFYLFHPQYPFFQRAAAEGQPVVINKLVRHRAAGNNPVYFDHSNDKEPRALSASESALHLTAMMAFSLLDGAGYSPSRLNNGIACYLTGKNLFQTLTLNTLITTMLPGPVVSTGADAPQWEQEPVSEKRSTLKGYLDYLTYPLRSVKLIPVEKSGQFFVEYMFFSAGEKLPEDILDPFLKYKNDEKKGHLRVLISAEKQLWRDYYTLTSLTDQTNERPPLNLIQAAQLKEDGVLGENEVLSMLCGGLSSENAKVHLWRFDILPLPISVLSNADIMNKIHQALETANAKADVLKNRTRIAAQQIASPDYRKADKDAANKLASVLSKEAEYWTELEVVFKSFVLTAAKGYDEMEAAFDVWVKECNFSLRKSWGKVENSLLNYPRGPEASARAMYYQKKEENNV